MLANYHTHTPRCGHAEGWEYEYVEEAIDAGIEILGFSDHSPQLFPGGYQSFIRMRPDELKDYCEALTNLQYRYRDYIELHIGLEVEYYPDIFGALCDYVKDYPIEYFILGQHWLGNEWDERKYADRKDPEAYLHHYVDQCIEALDTGKFLYFAHPDLVCSAGADEGEMRRLCEHAKKLDIPLEINLLGIDTGRNYPHPPFWEIAGEVGNTVILGSDAHRPQDVYRPRAMAEAMRMVEKYGLQLIEKCEL